MDRKIVSLYVLLGATALSACAPPLVKPEDRVAICTVAPATEICRTGRAWWWDPKRRAAHQLQVQFVDASVQKGEAQRAAARVDEPTQPMPPKIHDARRALRATSHFTSFEDALTALEPETDSRGLLLRDPLALKGHPIDTPAQIVQVVDGYHLLLNPCHNEEQTCPVWGTISPFYSGRREFVDDQMVELIGEVVGPYQYTTAANIDKTVPEVHIYGIRGAGSP